MKKQLILLLIPLCILLISSAMAEDIVLESDGYRVTFNNNGSIITLENTKTGTVFADCFYTEGFRLWFDLNHSDMWDCELYGAGRSVVNATNARSTKVTKAENGITFTHLFEVKTGQVTFTQTYQIENDQLRVKSTVDNSKLRSGTLMICEPLVLTGLSGDNLSLMWPMQEGEIYENALEYIEVIGDEYIASYPGGLSMQWVSLFDENESLYYGIHDTTAAHKMFFLKVGTASGCIELYGQLCPFVEKGQVQDLADVVIALNDQNGWMAGADIYRTFLAEEAGWVRNHPSILDTFTGWYDAVLAFPGGDFRAAYSKNNLSGVRNLMSDYASASKKLTDIDWVLIEGWQAGGATVQYPDFKFNEVLGGESAFREGIQEIHDMGSKAIVYVNTHAAEATSEWYNTQNAIGINGDTAATLTDAHTYYEEFHWSGYDHRGMCPGAQEFIDAIVDACVRLKDTGVDGIYFGQMMSGGSALCFNRNHNHSTPATNMADGHRAMMTAVQTALAAYDTETAYAAEGVLDAYLPYIDICGHSIFRPANHSQVTRPEITRYTLSNAIHLGIWSSSSNVRAQYGVPFVLGNPYLLRENFNDQVMKFNTLYKKYPDIYFNGTYEHTKGLSGLPEDAYVGVIVSAQEKRAAIHFFNPTGWPEDLELKYEAPGTITSAVNGLTGMELDVVDDTIQFMLTGWTPVPVIVTWE